MAMTPERVTKRVDELIESIRAGSSHPYARHNTAQTLHYIEQVHDLGIINAVQFEALVIAVNDAANTWQPRVDRNGLWLDG
jgi:hypothetical protein